MIDPEDPAFDGMTIRLYIATEAMRGILSSHEIIIPENREKLAAVSFQYADALIAEANK